MMITKKQSERVGFDPREDAKTLIHSQKLGEKKDDEDASFNNRRTIPARAAGGSNEASPPPPPSKGASIFASRAPMTTRGDDVTTKTTAFQ